jgi:hypothetical protein
MTRRFEVMETPEDRAARALFLAAMQAAGVGSEVADFERLGPGVYD